MVYLVLTRTGYLALSTSLGGCPKVLWVNAQVLTVKEIAGLRKDHVELTVFDHAMEPSDWRAIEDAIATIEEHHPGQSIFVEGHSSAAHGCG
ncbi:hypothetical protein [Leptothoe kymatousa]|uniref:Uncharacterized protein n=1 Tax=Leptothoe kymatousa TAU-MAC 1615 TaxID=2364775 RepID=A0ABS5Y7U7_9CYAN|nr:hypothetical protein [Leptothoe kymatousa]MBT9313454.1 hypothetical protein [Leptothoe kymatousa TAU-MAC 1615]